MEHVLLLSMPMGHVRLLSEPKTCFLPTNSLVARHGINRAPVSCLVTSPVSMPAQAAGRRSVVQYQPSVWSYSFLQSLKPKTDEKQAVREDLLKRAIRDSLHDEHADSRTLLLLIDDIQRLGLRHWFDEDIRQVLGRYASLGGCQGHSDRPLFTTSLSFRLLRQHGFNVSTDVFKCFMDHNGENFLSCLANDVEGMLSLYEASHFSVEDEQILEKAMAFTKQHLRAFKSKAGGMHFLQDQVALSLEIPLHRRIQLQESRWYIESYRTRKTANHGLLELAVMNFNVVQSILQDDLQHMSRWWTDGVGLGDELGFARDRLMECFFWTVGMACDPQFSKCRRNLTKVTSLVTTIDDVYDVYGSLDELELFTDAVDRWDVNAVTNLPLCMRLCFMVLYNTVHEMSYEVLKKHRVNVIPHLTKAWADLCKVFLQEAKWTHHKVTPTFGEYIDNGWVSVSGVLILVHSYFLCSETITSEALGSLEKFHDLLRWPSMIFRLCNDLGTSSAEVERGETANSILCYMLETGASEEEARAHSNKMIDSAWKKMNVSLAHDGSMFGKPFVEMAFNLAKISHYTYQNGDSHGAPDESSKERVHSLMINPISVASQLAETCL